MNKNLPIKYLLSILAGLVGFTVSAQNIPESYLLEAANNNPGLKSKFSEYMAALEKVPQAGALPDPQVTFGYFIQPVETRLGPQKSRISAMQMFPWFGTLGARKDAATQMAKSKYEIFEEAKSRLFYDTKSAWYDLYFNQKAIDITYQHIDILNTFRKIALIKVEAGLTTTVDVLRVEMDIAGLENQIALLKDNFIVSQTRFNNLLNVENQRLVDLPDSLLNMDIGLNREDILDSIRNGNHQILQMEFMQASYEVREIAARKTGAPSISLGIDYMAIGKSANPMAGISESGTDAIVLPMVGISIPIYRKKYTSMVKEAVLMQESSRNNILDRINVLETTFESANKDYRDADRRIRLYKAQTLKALQALNILQSAYETDGKNFEELLHMERQLINYNLELEKAQADKNAAMAFINYLMGK